MATTTALNTARTALAIDLQLVASDGSGDLRVPTQMRLAPGDHIWVADPGADAYLAEVISVDAGRARVLLEWSTQTELD
jgi:DsbC/DsbD-like thiol-disulfide interchange protein